MAPREMEGRGAGDLVALVALLCKYLHGNEDKWGKRDTDAEEHRYRTSGKIVLFSFKQEGLMKQGK